VEQVLFRISVFSYQYHKQDSVVSIQTRLRAGRHGVQIPAGQGDPPPPPPSKNRMAPGPNESPIQQLPRFIPGRKAASADIDHSPDPVSRLRMSGAVYLLPLHPFMMWTGKTLLFNMLVSFRRSSIFIHLSLALYHLYHFTIETSGAEGTTGKINVSAVDRIQDRSSRFVAKP
jgi:hypothetical protein